jgi:hypothetical protein
MVTDRLTDGVRIGQLLASEVAGNHGRLRGLGVSDADPDVEPTPDGALAYRLVRNDNDGGQAREDAETTRGGGADGADGTDVESVAEVYVQPDRVRIEFVRAPDAVADAAGEAGLRVRPKAVRPPRTLVFLEDGTEIKRVLPVLERVVRPERDG